MTETVPTSSYMICATPRTGSYLLCEGLIHTGLAGVPTEYLSPTYEAYWRPRWKADTYFSYLTRVKRIGTTANGVFGLKAHPVQLDHFSVRMGTGKDTPSTWPRDLLDETFPDTRYVWLRREDKVRQGISYAKALQSRIWWDADQPPAPFDAPRPDNIQFNRVLLERCITQMFLEEQRWRGFFDANGIEPLVLTYETMVQDISLAVKQVLGLLDLQLPQDFSLPPTKFRRQADSITDQWQEKLAVISIAEPALRMVQRQLAQPDPKLTATAAAGPATSTRPTPPAAPRVDLAEMLANRSWWQSSRPFAHVRADNVFRPGVFNAMEDQFQAWMAEGRFARDIPGYDVSAMAVTEDNAGAMSVFVSKEWHDMLARFLGIEATGELNLTLHHHGKASLSGRPHNDLNPAFFGEVDRRDGILVSNPRVCDYRLGTTQTNTEITERVRAAAVIFYFAQPGGYRGGGGETGLYDAVSRPVDRAQVFVPPVSNSLVAFECTPYSFHSFITNPNFERNCLVMWLHRPKEEAIRRWGPQSIVSW